MAAILSWKFALGIKALAALATNLHALLQTRMIAIVSAGNGWAVGLHAKLPHALSLGRNSAHAASADHAYLQRLMDVTKQVVHTQVMALSAMMQSAHKHAQAM